MNAKEAIEREMRFAATFRLDNERRGNSHGEAYADGSWWACIRIADSLGIEELEEEIDLEIIRYHWEEAGDYPDPDWRRFYTREELERGSWKVERPA